jgi:HK97 family phage major capsid protein
MPFNTMIDRTDAGELIPDQVAAEIISILPDSSAALTLFRQVRMSSKTYRQPVLASLPVAYWVNGDTGLKQTTEMSWEGISLVAEELAVILPIPENVLDDAGYPIWAEARPWLAAAIGKALDQAVFAGINKPASFAQAIIPGAVAAGNVVTAGTSTPAEGGFAGDLNLLMAAVEEDGYDVSGFAAKKRVRAALRNARDTTGQKLLDVSQNTIEGQTIVYVPNDVFDATTQVASGDFSMGLLGVRQDITWKLLDQSVISDAAGVVILNLAQQDAVALRVKARFGWAVANPVDAAGQVAGAYPFAVLQGTVTAATGATAGSPGTFTPAGAASPPNLAAMTGIAATPATAWTTGQYVILGDASNAYWNGTAWVAGQAAVARGRKRATKEEG